MNDSTVHRGSAAQALALLLGLLIIFGGIFIGAALISGGKLPESALPVAAYVPLGLGSFVAALAAAKLASGQKLLHGLAESLILLCCLAVLGMLWRDSGFQAAAAGLMSAILLSTGLLGALIGALHQKKQKRRR